MPTAYIKFAFLSVNPVDGLDLASGTIPDDWNNGIIDSPGPDGNTILSDQNNLDVVQIALGNIPLNWVVNSVRLRVHGGVGGDNAPDDSMTYFFDLSGTGAPSLTNRPTWTEADSGTNPTLVTRASDLMTGLSVAASDFNQWVVTFTNNYTQNMGRDDMFFAIDEGELEVVYTVVPWDASGAATLPATQGGNQATAGDENSTYNFSTGGLGEAIIMPRVYINTTQTTVGATRFTPVRLNTYGAAEYNHEIYFDHDGSGPTGSVFLGVQSYDLSVVWTPITVNASTGVTASGSPSITNPTSTGSATDVHITTGSPSTTNPTSTGVAELIRTASGAATLAAITAAGVAAPFIDATGSPSITNPTSTGVAEIVKTSTGTPSITNPTSTGEANVPVSSSGSPSTTNVTSSGTSEVIKTASGASATLNVTSSGVAEVVVTSTGTPSTTNVTSTGSARTFIDSTGTPSTVNPTSAGVSEIIKTSSGTPSTTNVTSTGVATSETVFTSSGTPSTTNVTSSGVSEVINTSSGSPSTTNVTSAGVAEIERTSSGSPSTTNVTSAGVSEIIRIASGSPSITAVISSGVSEIERTSSGSPSTTNVTSSGSSTVERSASGAPSVANPTSSGIASLGAQGVIGNSVIQSNALGSESSNTYSTPTGYEILGTALDGSSEYILVCFGHLGGSNNSNNECRARIIENGVGLVTGSSARIEPRGSGSSYGNHYGFVKKVTTSATPNDYEFQIRNNNVGVNTTTKAIHMMMLKLADLDTGDWAYAEDATSDLDIPSASWLDRDSVTIGDGNSTYLVFGHAQFEADNTSDDMRVILDIGGTEYGEYRMESEDPVEEHPTMVVAVVSGIAASTTAKVKVRSAEGIVNVIHSSIFALRLNAFEDWFVELDTTTSQTLISTVETDFVASTKTHTTSTDSARDWIIGSTTRYNIQSTANRTPQNKISDTTNSIEIGTTTNFDAGDPGAGWYHNGLNDIPTITRFNRISAINNGTNLDLDVVTRDSFETGHGPIDVTWWGFTTQLATVVTSSGTPSTTNPTSSGSSDVIKTASGSPSTTNVTSAGVSEIIRTASGSPSITAVISSGVSEVERTSSGSPSITNPTSAGVAEIVREASGAPSITNVTSAGSATRSGVFTSSGTPSITNPTSTGLATRVFTASGTPSITNVTSSGASHMWPKVYLNTSQTLAGATELTVTAASATSITFDDAVGPPVGSLFLGVENRNNGDVGWIAVTVTDVRTASGSPSITNPTSTGVASAGETFTASGTPSTTNVTSSGVAEIVKTASGTPSVTNPTSTGVAEIVKTATGTPSITNSTSTGVAEVIRAASGTPSITNSTSTGVAEVTRTASGAPSTTNVTSSGSANSFGQGQAAGNPSVTNPTSTGVAEVSRIASGSPSIVNPTSTGVVEVERLASGTPSIPNISSTGAAEIVGTTTGSPSITNPASTGVAEIIKTASGTPSIENLTASGSSNTFGTGQAAGNPSINGVTSTGETTVIRKASGSPSTNNPTSFAFATFVVTASGSPSITSPTGTGSAAQEVIQGSGTTFLVGLVTSSGVAEIYRFASGASVTSNPTSTGVAEVVNTASGSPSLDNIISSGVSEIIKTSSGSPSIEQVLSSGSAQTFIDTQGSPSLQQFTSTGSVRVTFKTNGTPSITPITGVGFTNFIALFPVTDYEIESQALETRFATNWIHTPIQWPNVHFDTRGVTEWVRFENNRDDSTQLTLGRNVELYRYFGEVIVEINVRPNSGANRALQLADLVDEVWRSAIFGVDYRIRMRAPRLEFVGNDRGWYKLRVVTPYQRDGYQNRSI